MALVLLNPNGCTPISLDGYDALSSSILGGECAKITAYGVTGSDKHAKDVDDGYSVTGLNTVRPIVSLTMDGNETGGFFLTDDGSTNYGVCFGVVVGGTAGQVVSGGTNLGPNTMTGSGKVTLWMTPGLYGVTLDALDATFAASTSVTVGTTLSYTSAGKLCLSAQKVGSAPVVARFVEFSASGSLVTTPHSLTRLGIAGGTVSFKHAVIMWNPPVS